MLMSEQVKHIQLWDNTSSILVQTLTVMHFVKNKELFLSVSEATAGQFEIRLHVTVQHRTVVPAKSAAAISVPKATVGQKGCMSLWNCGNR